jgi:hypothetical protein
MDEIPLGRPKCNREDNIKMDDMRVVWESVG